ncbi:MAG: hypothetical protein ABJB66_06240 [Gemmatimonadaceae bacterium]
MIAERLDTMSGESRALLLFTQDVKQLIDETSSGEQIELLLELIAERERVLGVLHKYLDAAITRGAFLSFVSAQRWPIVVRDLVTTLSSSELTRMAAALDQCDVALLVSLFDHQL